MQTREVSASKQDSMGRVKISLVLFT